MTKTLTINNFNEAILLAEKFGRQNLATFFKARKALFNPYEKSIKCEFFDQGGDCWEIEETEEVKNFLRNEIDTFKKESFQNIAKDISFRIGSIQCLLERKGAPVIATVQPVYKGGLYKDSKHLEIDLTDFIKDIERIFDGEL